MAKERVHWIDVAKGILILLLLISHFVPAMNRLGIDRSPFSFWNSWNIIFTSFFMQAFLFLSGYCSNFSKSFKQFFIGIFKQLVIPFVFFEFLICSYYSQSLLVNDIYSYWFSSNGTHLWFLNALIVSKVYIYCYIHFLKTERGLLLSTILLLTIAIGMKQYGWGTDFLCIKQSLGSIFYVALGHVCKNDSIMNRVRIIGDVFPYLLLFCFFVNIKIPTFSANINISLSNLVIFLMISITGIMAFINICKRIHNNSLIEYVGRNTLVIYCCHFIPLLLIINFAYAQMKPIVGYERFLFIIVVYVTEILICIGLIELFKLKPMKYLIGRY